MTTIIRAATAHDFLALLPALAGYRPERSLVCVAFRGNRTAGLIRHDLPRRVADHEGLIAQLVGTLCRMPGVDALVPVAYTPSAYGSARGAAERRLLERLVATAEDAGFTVRDALRVARDGWGSLLDPETPAAGHPLALIEASPSARDPKVRSASGRIADGANVPTPDPEVEGEVRDVLDRLDEVGRRDAFGRPQLGERIEDLLDRLGDAVDPVVLVERLVHVPPAADDRPEPLLIAWLAHLAARPAYRDAMMLQFAFGPVVGEVVLEDNLAMCAEAARYGESMDDYVERGTSEGVLPGDPMPARLLLGQTTVRPDAARVDRAIGMLRFALAHVPAPESAGLACIAAWLSWSLGRGTVAAALLDRAAEADPSLTMVDLLRAYLGSGALPEWAFHEEFDPAGVAPDIEPDPA